MKVILILVLVTLVIWRFGVQLSGKAFVNSSEEVNPVQVSQSRRSVSSLGGAILQTIRPMTELKAILKRFVYEEFGQVNGAEPYHEFYRVNKRRAAVSKWSLEEIESLCRSWLISEDGVILLGGKHGGSLVWIDEMWVDALFYRWGSLDPESALSFVRAFEAKAKEQSPEDVGLVRARSTALGVAAERFAAVMEGWASQEPRKVYGILNPKEISAAHETSVGRFYDQLIGGVFEHLVKVDAEFAIKELKESSEGEGRAFMLVGIANGLPTEFDYQNLIGELRSELGEVGFQVIEVLGGKLFSRWLAADSDAAMKWYQSVEADWVMPVERRDLSNLEHVGIPFDESIPDGWKDPFRYERPLAWALRHWFVKDPEQVTSWLQGHPKFLVPMIFGDQSYSVVNASIEARDVRKLLVDVLPESERRKLLSSIYGKDHLEDLITGSSREELSVSLRELQLGENFERELLDDLFDPKAFSDPFATDRE